MEFLAKLLGTPARKENKDGSVFSKQSSEATPSALRTTPTVVDLTAPTPPHSGNAGGVGSPPPSKKNSEVTPSSVKSTPVVVDLTAPTPPPPGSAPDITAPSPLPPLPQSPAVSQLQASEFYVGFSRQLVEDVILTVSSDTAESPDSFTTGDRSVCSDQHSLSDQSFDTASLGVTASVEEPTNSHTKGDTDSDGADFESADEQSLASSLAVLPAVPKHLNSVPEQLNHSFGLSGVISKLQAFSIESPAPGRVAQVTNSNPLPAIFSSHRHPTADNLDDSSVSDISTFSTQACHGSVVSESFYATDEPSFSALNFLAAAACETVSNDSEPEGELEKSVEVKENFDIGLEQIAEESPNFSECSPEVTESQEKVTEIVIQEAGSEKSQEESPKSYVLVSETPEKAAESVKEPTQIQETSLEKCQEKSPTLSESSFELTETPDSATEPEQVLENSPTFAELSPICTETTVKTTASVTEPEQIKETSTEEHQEESPKLNEISPVVTESPEKIVEEIKESNPEEKSPEGVEQVNEPTPANTSLCSVTEEKADLAQQEFVSEAALTSTPVLEKEKENTEVVEHPLQPSEVSAEITPAVEPLEHTQQETDEVSQEPESFVEKDVSFKCQEVATSDVAIQEVKEKLEELKLTEVLLVPDLEEVTTAETLTTDQVTYQELETVLAEELNPDPEEEEVGEKPEVFSEVVGSADLLPESATEQEENKCEISSQVVESTNEVQSFEKVDSPKVKEKSSELDNSSEHLVDSFEIVETPEEIPTVCEEQVSSTKPTEETHQVKEILETKQVITKSPGILFGALQVEDIESVEDETLDIALPEEAAAGGLTELLDLCNKQAQELSERPEEVPFEDLLAAGAELICQEIHNASLRLSEDEDMENPQEIKTPVRKSGSPRNHSSPQRGEDSFRPRYRLSSSPSREVGRSSPGPASMSSSGDSAVVSSKMHRDGSIESGGSPKSLPSQDSGISGAEVNHSEAGPVTAEEQFVSADIFKDPNAFDFLSRLGGGSGASVSRLERESLYVKFDPLVGARDQRKVFLSPCLETSRGENTSIEDSPVRPRSQQPESDTPLSHVGTLISIGSPSPPKHHVPSSPANMGASGDAGGDTPTMHQVAFAQELLERQAKAFEERMERELEKQREQHSREKEAMRAQLEKAMASEVQQASAKSNSEKQFSLVMKEYEDTISTMLADQEHKSKAWVTDKGRLEAERKQAQDDLAGAELAFSDLHRKYERAKDAIVGLKSNEEALRRSNTDFQASLEKANLNYQKLKTHAEMQLDKANQEIDQLLAAKEGDQAAHEANVKRLKMQITSLEQSMAVLHREKQELVSICDDLLAKFGPNKS